MYFKFLNFIEYGVVFKVRWIFFVIVLFLKIVYKIVIVIIVFIGLNIFICVYINVDINLSNVKSIFRLRNIYCIFLIVL